MEGVEGRDQMFHKEAMIRHPCMPVHSLVANVLPIVIISKVVTIKDPSRLKEDSNTSEHHMPGVPAHTQGSTANYMNVEYVCMLVCVCACVCPVRK